MLDTNILVTILKNDDALTEILKQYYVLRNIMDYTQEYITEATAYNNTLYYSLAELLLNNEDYIYNTTIEDLVLEDFLKFELKKILKITTVDNKLLHYIFYSFKYSNVKSFFYDNKEQFLPEIEIINIQSKDKLKIFYNSLMKEFDKFSSIIADISNLADIDKMPLEYLDYLSQLLGYEKQEHVLLINEKYRILIKNIIEIYKIKGTNYSLELFFNFLGYSIEVNEYWFDRRYANYIYNQNPYTGEIDKSLFTYYLTPLDPTENILSNAYPKEMPNKNLITKQLNLFNFNILAQKYEPNILLGYKKNEEASTNKYNGDLYKFFKTNAVNFKITVLSNTEAATGDEELKALNMYINFLTPINIIKFVSFVSLYPAENAGYQYINGIKTRAIQLNDYRRDTTLSYYIDELGDIRKIFEQSGLSGLLLSYSKDYDILNPESATWLNEIEVEEIYIRYSLDNGVTWITPFLYNYDTILKMFRDNQNNHNIKIQFSNNYVSSPLNPTWLNYIYINNIWVKVSFDTGATWTNPFLFKINNNIENTFFFDYDIGKRGTLKEKYINVYIILSREPNSELSTIASYYPLSQSNGKLHSNSSSKKVENSNQQSEYPIEKIIWEVSDLEYGDCSEVWILKPSSTFNPLRGSVLNNIEIRNSNDYLQDGIYTIYKGTTYIENSLTYYILTINKITLKKDFSGTGDLTFGGLVSFITDVGFAIYAITKTNTNNNSVIRIINPYPRKIPNFSPENKILKTITTSVVSINYLNPRILNIINKTYKIKGFSFTRISSKNDYYLDIEVEQITDLPSNLIYTGSSYGVLIIDKDRFYLNKKRYNLLDDKDFKWIKQIS